MNKESTLNFYQFIIKNGLSLCKYRFLKNIFNVIFQVCNSNFGFIVGLKVYLLTPVWRIEDCDFEFQ